MPDYTPVFVGADHWTSTTSAAVTGGQVLMVSGSATVAPAAGPSSIVGVAAFDAPSGGKVTVHGLGGLIHNLIAGAAITAGQTIKAATGGQVVPWIAGTDAADQAVGVALTTQSTTGQPVRVVGTR